MKMKKKSLLLLTALSVCAVTISMITAVNLSDSLSANYNPVSYTMTLDRNNKVTNYSQGYDPDVGDTVATGKVKTDMGTSIDLRMSIGSAFYEVADCFVDYTDGGMTGHAGYFELASPVNGLIKMEYEVDCDLHVSVGYSKGNYLNSTTILISGGMSTGTFNFDELVSDYHIPPSYLKISTNADDLSHKIKKIKLFFSCTDSGDPTAPVGNFITENNKDVPDALTITGFNMDGYAIPANKTLIIPNKIDGREVVQICEGVFDNVPWVEHLYIPFCGASKYLDHKVLGLNFAVIFGHNDIHIQYQAIQQYTSAFGYVIYYIPKALKHITVTGCTYNMPNHDDIKCIPDYAFYGCNQMITEIDFTCDFVTVNEGAFGNCSGLKELILPASCTEAKKGAFAGCSRLYIRALNYNFDPNANNSNPDNRGCSSGYVMSVELDGVYYDVVKNENTISRGVVTGGDMDLEYLFIPSSIHIEGYGDVSVFKIANRAFEGHENLRTVIFDYLYIDMFGHYAFKDCYRATFLLYDEYDTWPSDWHSGAGRVYYNYASLEDPQVIDGYHYYQMDKPILEKDPLKKGCLFYEMDETVGSVYDFTGELAKVKESDPDYEGYYTAYFMTAAFENDLSVTEIRLPINMVLPNYAFAGCSNLTDVYYEGTEDDWNVLKNDRKAIGYNLFHNTSISVIHVSDGSGGYTDIPLI